jgi:hypothetical protein
MILKCVKNSLEIKLQQHFIKSKYGIMEVTLYGAAEPAHNKKPGSVSFC